MTENNRLRTVLLLLIILLLGASLRFVGINWGEGQAIHPDEEFLRQVTSGVQIPEQLDQYFNTAESPLNPYNRGYTFFVYGTFPLFLTRAVGEALDRGCEPPYSLPVRLLAPALLGRDVEECWPGSFSMSRATGRMLAAVFDLGTILFVFLAGRRLRSSVLGLLAAFLYAMAVLPIQQSHFYTVDAFAGFFAAGVLYLSIRAAQTGSGATFVLAGVMVGLGVATKISVWPLGLVVALAGLVRARLDWQAATEEAQHITPEMGEEPHGGMDKPPRVEQGVPDVPEGEVGGRLPESPEQPLGSGKGLLPGYTRPLLWVAVAGVVALLAFRIAQPYAFMGPGLLGVSLNERWLDNMAEIRNTMSGGVDVYYGYQWINRPALIFPWINMVFWGMGLPLGLAVWAAWSVALVVVVRYRRDLARIGPLLIVWAWATAYFLYQGTQWVKSIRYFVPIYSAFILLAAWLLIGFIRWAWNPPGRRRARWLATITSVIVVGGTVLWALASTSIYTRTHTRIAASRWIFENVPTVATAHLRTPEGETQVQVVIPSGVVYTDGVPLVSPFKVREEVDLVGVTINYIADPQGDEAPERFRVGVATDPGGESVMTELVQEVSPPSSVEGTGVMFSVLPTRLRPGIPYYLVTEVEEGGTLRLLNASAVLQLHDPEDTGLQRGGERFVRVDLIPNALYHEGAPQFQPFTVDVEADLVGISLLNVTDSEGDAEVERFRVAVAADPEGQTLLTNNTVELSPPGEQDLLRVFYPFEPVRLLPGATYYLVTEVVEGGPLQLFTSVLGTEHWDWPPPLRIDGYDPFGGMYSGLSSSSEGTLQLYHPDSPQKREQLLEWLDEADYIITGSNRLYASIPRRPERYPLTLAYYEALFAEELGFELVADFVSPMALGPFQFPDQEEPFPIPEADYQYRPAPISAPMPPAEETFSVYDHPRVLIFRKTEAYSRQRVETLLPPDLVVLDPATREVVNAGQILPDGMLDPQRWAEQRAGGTWHEMFNRDSLLNRVQGLGAAVWYLVVSLLGWLAFPLLFVALPRLRDRGYGLARLVGLLLVSYLTWLAASLHLLPNTRGTILLMMALLALGGGVLGWTRRRSLVVFLRAHWRTLAVEEGLMLLLFVAWLWVRSRNPDLWHVVVGGEKPMDFAYLNAVIKSTWFPPYDPWFAGGRLNYYYFGFVLVSTLTKLLGILPSIAYNLTLALFFSLVGGAAFSVAFNLAARHVQSEEEEGEGEEQPALLRYTPYLAGGLAVLFFLVLGNLGELRVLVNGFRTLGGELPFQSTIPGFPELLQTLRGVWQVVRGASLPFRYETPYWEPTRMLPPPAFAEFPAFTFIYGDPHAHLFALPYTLVVLGLVLNWVRGGFRLREGWLLSGLLGGLVLGSLWAANSWDYPTYVLVVLGGLGLAILRTPLTVRRVVGLVWRAAWVVGLSFLLFQPYLSNNASSVEGLMLMEDTRIPLDIYLLVVGQFLFPLVTLLLVEGWQLLRRFLVVVGGGALLLGLLFTIAGIPIAIVVLPVGVLAAVLVLMQALPVERRLAWMLLTLAMSISLGVALFSVGVTQARMNTVFKFYYQMWTLLAVIAAAAIAWLIDALRRWQVEARQVWWVGMGVLLFAMALFPIMSIPSKLKDRFTHATGPTLDGMAYLEYVPVYYDPRGEVAISPDYDAIRFLQEEVEGSPVILEGVGDREYSWESRVSIYTGLPTVLGWRWHQVQQRMGLASGQWVDLRRMEVIEAYDTTSTERALEILAAYDVRYVYVGPYERLYYSPEGLAKFDTLVEEGWLEVVYDSGQVRIYEAVGGR